MNGGLITTQRPGAGLLADVQAPMPIGNVPAGGLLGLAMQALLRKGSMQPAPQPQQQDEAARQAQDRAMAELLGLKRP